MEGCGFGVVMSGKESLWFIGLECQRRCLCRREWLWGWNVRGGVFVEGCGSGVGMSGEESLLKVWLWSWNIRGGVFVEGCGYGVVISREESL